MSQSVLSRVRRYALSVALIASITAIDSRYLHVNSTTVALTFVLAVLGVATVLASRNPS